MKASWPAFTPGTQRLVVVFLCLYTIGVTLVLVLQRRASDAVTSATLRTAPVKVTTSLYHAQCSYQSYAFAEQYEAMAAHPVMPPPGLARLQRARPSITTKRSWRDCLPVRSVICGVAAGDQDSLFTQHPPCRSAVLHHLLMSTMAAMEARGHVALPIGAALEHMWEYGALPPATPVLDMVTNATDDVTDWLWARGLAHFYDKNAGDITCLAAHHPLASLLYAGNVVSYEVPPHLRWSRIESMTTDDDKFRVAPQLEHAYRYAQLTPPTCLRLYNASILAPAHPPTFFTAARGMRDHDGDAAIYPNPLCQALCKNDAPPVARNVTPNVARCPLHADAVYDARLATFRKDPIPLVLDAAHTRYLAPFNDTAKLRAGSAWEFCLPMKPQQCGARRGTKSTLFETPPGKPCRSAVLQLLLENMLEVTYDLSLPAFVYFGTLLGAWRDEAIIPHTRDIDIVMPSDTDWAKVQDAMWARGFYVFKRDIHGACVASHHPLAGLLYAPNTPLVKTLTWDHGTPYLDLYMWRRAWRQKIGIETALEKLDRRRVFPLQCNEKIFGSHVPGIQDPEAMFRTEYSTTYAQDPDLHLESCESYCDYQVLANATTV